LDLSIIIIALLVRGIHGVNPEEEKVDYGGKDLQKRKVLSLEWKSRGVMDDESGELMELGEDVPLKELTDGGVQCKKICSHPGRNLI